MNRQNTDERSSPVQRQGTSAGSSPHASEMNSAESVSAPAEILPQTSNIVPASMPLPENIPAYEIHGAFELPACEQLTNVHKEIDQLMEEFAQSKVRQDDEKETAFADTSPKSESGFKPELHIEANDDQCSLHINSNSADSEVVVDKSPPNEDSTNDEAEQMDDLPPAVSSLDVYGSSSNMHEVNFMNQDENGDHLTELTRPALVPSRGNETDAPLRIETEGSQGITKKRVNVLSLPVVENPLQKEGRHTVIRGRLPDNHPFFIAAQNLGAKMVSRKMEGFSEGTDDETRRRKFHEDLHEFLRETHSKNTKLPIIGGGNLDLFALMREVLLLGGVENVVKKRAFRIVAQQLELPKSCTSAAYVLKGAYEKFLYFYETRLVFGTWPENANRRVDMKSKVSEQQQREKLANQSSSHQPGTKKRRRGDPHLPNCSRPANKRRPVEMDSRVIHMLSTISNDAASTHRYLRLLTAEASDSFRLPEWALQVSANNSYYESIERIQQLDDSNNVQTSGGVILLAMAECFEKLDESGQTVAPARSRDLGLAKAICLLPTTAPVTRKAQACLFSLIVQVTKTTGMAVLANNNSAKGLLDGIFALAQIFRTKNVDSSSANTIPFLNSRNRVVNRDAAAAYCALRILSNLTKEVRNREVIMQHPGIDKVLLPLFGHKNLHRDFAITVLDVLQDVAGDLPPDAIDVILEGLLPRLATAACLDCDGTPDYDVSTRALTVLYVCGQSIAEDSAHLVDTITMTRRLQHSLISILNTTALAVTVHALVERFPDAVMADERFVDGMFVLLRDPRCTSIVADSLTSLHRVHPLHEAASRAGLTVPREPKDKTERMPETEHVPPADEALGCMDEFDDLADVFEV